MKVDYVLTHEEYTFSFVDYNFNCVDYIFTLVEYIFALVDYNFTLVDYTFILVDYNFDLSKTSKQFKEMCICRSISFMCDSVTDKLINQHTIVLKKHIMS
jgi:hypothetical protein